MLIAFATLLGCELLGELLRGALHLPIPGPVIGMFVLTIGLTLRPDADVSTGAPVLRPLDRTAGTLLEHMGYCSSPPASGLSAKLVCCGTSGCRSWVVLSVRRFSALG